MTNKTVKGTNFYTFNLLRIFINTALYSAGFYIIFILIILHLTIGGFLDSLKFGQNFIGI